MRDTIDDTLTPEEVAARLKISAYTARRLLKERKLRGIKIAGGHLWRIYRADFDAYLHSRDYQPMELSPGMETAILSEPALSRESLTPWEDEYWAHL